jgi:nicotinamide-nucleotide amidase
VDVTQLVEMLKDARRTVAVAESLTGGLLMATLTDVPGVSAVLRGGAVVYATDTKASMLDVDDGLLAAKGPVSGEVALAMAVGVRARWGADFGVATTGVAGPDPQDGHLAGEVYVAVSDADGSVVERLHLSGAGGRRQIRAEATEAALGLLAQRVGQAAREASG